MNAEGGGFSVSVWGNPEHTPTAPKYCPSCGLELAHPDDLRENDSIEASGTFQAYRKHRHAHYNWGEDPTTHGAEPGDPYLAHHYDGDKSAAWEPEEDDGGVSGDPDETVGHVFDVDIRYEATVRATVVAPDRHRAEEKADELRMMNDEDFHGNVPTSELTMELHTDSTKVDDVRRDEEAAERMEGWPW
jgi:hypothetical protein